jgi:hypothetical protein
MNSKKEVRQLLKVVRRNGYIVDDRGKHYKVLGKDGTFLVGISSTPSDPLALKRIRCDLRRVGIL